MDNGLLYKGGPVATGLSSKGDQLLRLTRASRRFSRAEMADPLISKTETEMDKRSMTHR